eukprot:CAMPEP_0116135676 /NCGR_PEP_ID=MMETSP0329-20121206/11317_1 /TAXON_ID=697910 /ORGANISM="Pseudo-nitzschia arenysensis, Strain B593" /LENGTH=271 /DNA_ID=CAMNT_0003630491 /DNA_START=280 /DNA_END=1095 /DNA_ORIENTATION=-
MMKSTESSSTASLAIHSIATVAGIATIHAFVSGGMFGRMTKPKKGQAEKRLSNDMFCTVIDAEDSKEEEKEEVSDFPTSVVVTLPDWTTEFYTERKNKVYKTDKEMMGVAMELSKINCKQKTGGPFGTAIFEYDPQTKESKLFSIGVNRVVPCSNSTLHGEMTAIQFGQQKIKDFSFSCAGAKIGKEYHLYTSCAPCCQCLGGVLWSGVSKLVCGASKADAESIGFSEGPVFDQSYVALEEAGCKVIKDVLRDECNDVLQWYGNNGEIYNP